jgi:hypothetical protein
MTLIGLFMQIILKNKVSLLKEEQEENIPWSYECGTLAGGTLVGDKVGTITSFVGIAGNSWT